MIDLENIHSLTDFKRNASNYVDRVRDTQSPLVLTVNGKAAVVVQDAVAFQELVNRCEAMEAELKELKRQALRQDIQVGIDQLANGQYSDYSGDELDTLFDQIAHDGREQLETST
jgi:prevent-host-death family protein